MEISGEPPPLWPQLATTSMHGRRRRSLSSLFSLPVLIILLPTIALLLLFFAVAPFMSTIAGQIFRPTGVKKNSDSFNIFLVFFAIICGVFARRNDGDVGDNNSRNEYGDTINNNKQNHLVSQRWFDQYPERKIYDDHPPVNAAALTAEPTGVRRLKRNSSSYPDLRQDSLWENCEDRSRFFDDFEINRYRSTTDNYNDQAHELHRSWRNDHFEESEPKVISCDTFVFRSSPSSPLPSMSPTPSTPPPPPPPPPPAAAYHKPRRTYQAVRQKEKVMKRHMEFDESGSPKLVTPPPPPRRPPSPLVQTGNRSELRYAKLERRRSNATKEIKMVFASLRKRRKKEAKDHNHVHQHDYPLHSQREPSLYYSTTIPPPSPPPPPPPMPPPPYSVFQKYNLFRSKASKSKKIHSAPPASPPPPPPTPPQPFSVSKLMQNTQTPPTTPPPAPPTPPPEPSRRRTTAKANRCRPPLPTKANTNGYYDENMNSGGQSPLIPKPPPPPPFKMSELKFVFSGDFVKIRSSHSSRCSSPDIEEVDVPSSKDEEETVSMKDGDDGGGVGVVPLPVVCPSPDVNAKAETFIARLRDGWKLEKINSMKEKQRI